MRLWILACLAALCGFFAVYFALSQSMPTAGPQGAAVPMSLSKEKPKNKPLAGSNKLKLFIRHKTPKPFKDFSFVNETGETVSLSDWKGKKVLLNLWATWCAPCREEMPSLNTLKGKLDAANYDVVALSVDHGGMAKPKAFFKDHKIDKLKLYHDPTSKLMFTLKSVGLPATILFNEKGEEIGRMAGPANWGSDEAVKLVTNPR